MKLPAYEQRQLDTIGATPTTDYLLENYRRRPSVIEAFGYLRKGQGERGFKPATAGQVAEATGRAKETARKAMHELERIGAITTVHCWIVWSGNDMTDHYYTIGELRPEVPEGYHFDTAYYAHVTHNHIIPPEKKKPVEQVTKPGDYQAPSDKAVAEQRNSVRIVWEYLKEADTIQEGGGDFVAPNRRVMADDLGISYQTVSNALRDLEKLGVIEMQPLWLWNRHPRPWEDTDIGPMLFIGEKPTRDEAMKRDGRANDGPYRDSNAISLWYRPMNNESEKK